MLAEAESAASRRGAGEPVGGPTARQGHIRIDRRGTFNLQPVS